MVCNSLRVSCIVLSDMGKWRVGCSFSANDSRGAEAAPLTITVQLCNCSGAERGQCVWDELQEGYNSNDTFQIVDCDCNGTLYEGQ